jgi:hypothetical protein
VRAKMGVTAITVLQEKKAAKIPKEIMEIGGASVRFSPARVTACSMPQTAAREKARKRKKGGFRLKIIFEETLLCRRNNF